MVQKTINNYSNNNSKPDTKHRRNRNLFRFKLFLLQNPTTYAQTNKGNNKNKLQYGSNNKFKNLVNSSPLHDELNKYIHVVWWIKL